MNKTIVFALIFTLFGFMAQAQYVNQTSAYSQEGVLNQVLYQDGSGNRALNVKIVDPATATRVTTAAYGIDSIFSQVAYADGTDYALGLIIRDLSLGSGTSMTDLTLTQGTITDPAPVLDITSTWNDAADNMIGIQMDITDTASSALSNIVDLQVDGTSVFTITKTGLIQIEGVGLTDFGVIDGTAATDTIRLARDTGTASSMIVQIDGSYLGIASGPELEFQSQTTTGAVPRIKSDQIAARGGALRLDAETQFASGDTVFEFRDNTATAAELLFTIDGIGNVDVSGDITVRAASSNVSNPPTDAELDSLFGTPATVGSGFVGLVDDSDSNNMYRCYSDGTNWFTVAGVLAV